MPMALGLGIGLSFTQNPPSKSVANILCEAIANKVLVTADYDGASITIAPLVIYELDSVLRVDGVLQEDLATHGNRPPAVISLEVSALSSANVSQATFSIHPRLVPILNRYQNVKCIVITV